MVFQILSYMYLCWEMEIFVFFYLIYYTIEYKKYSQSSMIPHLSFSLKITTKTKISDCYFKKMNQI